MSRPDSSELAAFLARHLRDRAGAYFAEFAGRSVRVLLRRSRTRSLSWLFDYELTADGLHRGVVAKALAPRLAGTSPPPPGRPGLGKPCDPQDRVRFEYDTLVAVQHHFASLEDPRFVTIRMLDLLKDRHTILMERSEGRTLRHVFIDQTTPRSRTPRAGLSRTIRSAGGWLRAYHRLPPVGHALPHRTRQADLLASIRAFAEFLDADRRQGGRFGRLADALEPMVCTTLPEAFPLAMAHGDYALRNVHVDATGRVAGFDSMGRWLVPTYQDVAHFLTALKLIGPQLLTQGLWCDRRLFEPYERLFLEGVFEHDPVPRAEIRLFEIEAVLDKFAAASLAYRSASGPRRLVERLSLWARHRYFHRHLAHLLTAAGAPPDAAGAARRA